MQQPAAARSASPFGAWGAAAAIILYILLLTALRLALSPFLEIDEAAFVGAVDLRLVYADAHPPLYAWLVRGALELTDGRWILAVAAVKAGLLAALHLLVFDAARRVAGATAGLVAVALTALMPQLSFMAAHTLTHPVLASVAAAGLVNGVARLATGPRWSACLVLGVALAAGALAQPEIWLLAVPLGVAMIADRFWYDRLASAWTFLVPLLVGIIAGPALWALADALKASGGRIGRLYAEGRFEAVDVSGVGVDGVLSLAVAAGLSGGLVALLVLAFARTRPALAAEGHAVRRLLWRTLALALTLSAAGVLAADVSVVAPRALMPILMPLPVVAALHLAGRRPWALLKAGATVFLLVPVAIAGVTAFGDHRFVRPYDVWAREILAAAPQGRIAVTASRQVLAANMMLAFRRAGRDAWVAHDRHAPLTDVAVVLAPGPGAAPAPPDGLCPDAEVTTTAPLRNLAATPMTVRATIARRCRP
ncbi:glycosyltransferase family 39 protein [Acuticoccus sp. I52.16.1]|uniref:glycosyltransferase family 39 protein n=1 Tax=Acuticoccus sp. I52.16.1 TaxID=2928472 RepID=UPI001FD302A9|nr:glycosyltransferase family 39 protein [Acuticoccus sp. I52.16.1]UOM35928.1 glycosyltransferase family 39 protein [Acuticoccus sp. I52.16.1]